MITVTTPTEDILHVEPGYYGRPKKTQAKMPATERSDTFGCPCDICPNRSGCEVFCSRFEVWVMKGSKGRKSKNEYPTT